MYIYTCLLYAIINVIRLIITSWYGITQLTVLQFYCVIYFESIMERNY